MGTFYQENPRKFDKAHLVLLAYTHVVAFKRTYDTIMISADTHNDIMPTFDIQMKFLKRRNPVMVWYLPDCCTPEFGVNNHGEA